MRLLLDESLPKGLAAHLAGHEVQTAQGAGWAGVANGELLRLAAEAGFDALLTPDRGLEFEQNAETLPVRVVVLLAPSNRLEDLEPLVGEALRALDSAGEKRLLMVGN